MAAPLKAAGEEYVCCFREVKYFLYIDEWFYLTAKAGLSLIVQKLAAGRQYRLPIYAFIVSHLLCSRPEKTRAQPQHTAREEAAGDDAERGAQWVLRRGVGQRAGMSGGGRGAL